MDIEICRILFDIYAIAFVNSWIHNGCGSIAGYSKIFEHMELLNLLNILWILWSSTVDKFVK